MAGHASNVVKNRADDRVLVLAPMEGEFPLNSLGLVDKRLFTGKNKLHAKMDKETSMWSLYYEQGIVPEQLSQRFTTFTKLLDFTTTYFKQRNIEIKEVID